MSYDPATSIRVLLGGGTLGRSDTEALFGALMDGALDEVQKTAMLVALAVRGETPEEIAGAALAMRSRVLSIPHNFVDVVDTCGTGGDGRGTFNVSTAAALVAAAGGARIAKHGNRSVSSRSGSADVLAALGVDLGISPVTAGRALAEVGIAFLFAPALHPAMREVMPIRRALGVRTVFNLLGPLTNPAGAKRQVMGVFAAKWVEPCALVLAELGAEHALVVHGVDGLDEITTTAPTQVAEVRGGKVEMRWITPEDLGVARARPEDLAGGAPEDNAQMMLDVLGGAGGPLGDIVAVNAGAALLVAGKVASLREGYRQAQELLAAGAGLGVLEALRGVREPQVEPGGGP